MAKETPFEEIQSAMEDLNKKVSALMGSKFEDAKEMGAEKIEDIKNKAKAAAKAMHAKAEDIDEFAYEKPWVLALIIGTAGFVVGSLMSHAGSRKK